MGDAFGGDRQQATQNIAAIRPGCAAVQIGRSCHQVLHAEWCSAFSMPVYLPLLGLSNRMELKKGLKSTHFPAIFGFAAQPARQVALLLSASPATPRFDHGLECLQLGVIDHGATHEHEASVRGMGEYGSRNGAEAARQRADRPSAPQPIAGLYVRWGPYRPQRGLCPKKSLAGLDRCCLTRSTPARRGITCFARRLPPHYGAGVGWIHGSNCIWPFCTRTHGKL